jgi:hypothetical protein
MLPTTVLAPYEVEPQKPQGRGKAPTIFSKPGIFRELIDNKFQKTSLDSGHDVNLRLIGTDEMRAAIRKRVNDEMFRVVPIMRLYIANIETLY